VRAGTVFRYLWLYAGAFVFLLPLIWMVVASLRTQQDLFDNPASLIPGSLTFDAYGEVWRQIPFGRFFVNTVVFAGTVTVISLFFDALAAYALAKLEFRGKNVVFWLVLIVLMVPFQITLVPLFQLMSDLGLVNTIPGLVLPRITNAFGIFMLRQFFISLPRELDDAARVDGLSEWGIFRKIVLPLSKPVLVTLALFHFMYNWNDLLWPLVMTTSEQMRTLPAGLALFMGTHVVNHPVLMAGATIAMAPLIIGFVFAQRYFIQSVAMTGIK
jgi:multiple sugar transport system permease protein